MQHHPLHFWEGCSGYEASSAAAAAATAEDASPATEATSLATSQDLHNPSPNPSLSQGVSGEATRLGAQY